MTRLGIGVIAAALSMPAAGQRAQEPTCDSVCLAQVMSSFVKAMTTGAAASVPLAEYAEIRENARAVPLSETAWKGVRSVRSSIRYSPACCRPSNG